MNLSLQKKIAAIGKMTKAFEKFCKKNHISEIECFRINLVMDELVTNVISFAKPKSDIRVSAVLEDKNQIILTLCDDGMAFDPLTESTMPGIDAPLDNPTMGGLNIHIAQIVMDVADYERRDGLNIMTLTKKVATDP